MGAYDRAKILPFKRILLVNSLETSKKRENATKGDFRIEKETLSQESKWEDDYKFLRLFVFKNFTLLENMKLQCRTKQKLEGSSRPTECDENWNNMDVTDLAPFVIFVLDRFLNLFQ